MSQPVSQQHDEIAGISDESEPEQQQEVRKKRQFAGTPVAQSEQDGPVKKQKAGEPTATTLASPFQTPSTTSRISAADLDNFARMLAAGDALRVNIQDLAKGISRCCKAIWRYENIVVGTGHAVGNPWSIITFPL